ncbi:MAG: M14 family zinc carboxypeptidase, partial [Haliscomenobacter sp.]
MQKFSILLAFLAFSILPFAASAQLKTPDEFLPHKLGEQFTPHEMLVDYVRHVAANSPNVRISEYGRTNEQRPLMLLFVSTPENLAKLEDIRRNNLKRAGILEGQPDPGIEPGIVWISFNVHGNEAAGSESSMAVLHALADTKNPRTQEWLKNTLVILDPCINPDGQARYTHWYRIAGNRVPDPRPEAREHQEPWPGGRT